MYAMENTAGRGSQSPGQLKDQENVTLMSTDLNIQEDYILQFSISVGCNSSTLKEVAPVHLQYSLDYGMTWIHIIEQCIPFLPMCHGIANTASVYYPSTGWRRITIPLKGPLITK